MELKLFDQSQMQDLPFINTIEHILCSSRLCVELMVNPGWRMLEVALIRVYLDINDVNVPLQT